MFGLFSLLIPLILIGVVVTVVVVSVNKSREKGVESGEPISPKDIFLHLLAAATLYISAIGVLVLIWGLAEYWFPDPYRGFNSGSDGGAVRGGVSMAIVAFPIFVYLTVLVRRRIKTGELDPMAPLRTGFVYVNLFLVTVAALITLMVTVNAFLAGDLTPRFLIRAGGVLGIVGLIYLYYRSELDAIPLHRSPNSAEPEVSK
ncbi:MAG: DUF5671 domain-containing protein [Actinomycetota bacterium]